MASAEKHLRIHDFLEMSSVRYSDKIALICRDVRMTYRQINDQANSLANWLVDRGVLTGDRILLLLENGLEYIVGYYGILKIGAVAVPLSPDLKQSHLEPLIAEIEPKTIITSSKSERTLISACHRLPKKTQLLIKNSSLNWETESCVVTEWSEMIKSKWNGIPDFSVSESDLASIIYTSGSTGVPKGAMLTHGNIVSNTCSICRSLELDKHDVQMVVLPFSYVMGKSLLNTHFAVGGTVVINNHFAFPATVINQMIEENVTGFSGVPATFAYLLHRSPLRKMKNNLKSLRYCSQAGGHLSNQLKRELMDILPDHTKLFIMYGATEASARLTCMEQNRFREKIGSVGKPIPGVSIRVVDERGRSLPADHSGEILAEGDNIMKGYWKDEILTRKVLNGKEYHTGDLGYLDKEGFVYITGRKDNQLKIGGYRINPEEIEDVLMDTELVTETAVVGISDPILGFKLVAVVVPIDNDCSEQRIMQRCRDRLPNFKLPSELFFIRSIPKTSYGKVDRSKCIEWVIQKGSGKDMSY